MQQEAGKAWDTVKQEAGELWEGVKIGAAQLGNTLKDTAISLYEDPLGTGKDMLYNATIGTVEDIWDTAAWAGRMVLVTNIVKNRGRHHERSRFSRRLVQLLGSTVGYDPWRRYSQPCWN